MTNEEILADTEAQYAAIKVAEERLKELRDNICKHEEIFEGNYSWRVGVLVTTFMCKFCHKPIEFPGRPKF